MKALELKVPPPARLAFVLYMNRFQIDPEAAQKHLKKDAR